MKKSISGLAALALLLTTTSCATPMTTLKHPKTGQVATCGGSSNGALVGGVIGYHIQKDNDEDCVKTYEKQGFKPVK